MKINALKLDKKDNVVTCIMSLRCGDKLIFCDEQTGFREMYVSEDIPILHKVAICEIEKSQPVYKYGEVIGCATCDITTGMWVSHNNIVSVPRDYQSEIIR